MRLNTLDLHGYTVADAMSRFARTYNWMLSQKQGGQLLGLKVIHGKGKVGAEGLIRETLRDYLRTQGKRINGYDAQLLVRGAEYLLEGCGNLAYAHGEDVDRNGGQTIVVPLQRIRPPRL